MEASALIPESPAVLAVESPQAAVLAVDALSGEVLRIRVEPSVPSVDVVEVVLPLAPVALVVQP